ncbi:MAG: ABC transporter substrate-binding protein [Deltaproteobacteria bacterium]|nr:MAG: ABC transporter substrate-binding protein [Deltaproteobacteria bacterium]
MLREKLYCFAALAVFCVCGLFPQTSQAADKFKVLVVMSYEENFVWCKDIKDGIDSVLESSCDIRYSYMDTKTNFAGGQKKAEEAYALYQEFQPAGVITVDDNAQSMFVVPYLKDKVKIPIMFCGVNAEPEKYGYPASNVSGILERPHIAESVAFLKQLVPSAERIGFIARDSSTTRGISEHIQGKADKYPIKFVAFKLPKTMNEATAETKELRKQCDALFMANLEGLPGEDGKPMTKKDIIPVLADIFNKPSITDISKDIKYGIFCSIAVTGQEQGGTSAKMLMKAMQGTPVSQIPITRNYKGKPMINVTTMRALGIKPKPGILHTAELVTTEK